MRSHHLTIFFFFLLVITLQGRSQDCEYLRSASINTNVEYLHRASLEHSPFCIDEAFANIARAKPKEGIPELLKLLTYERPVYKDPSSNGIFAIHPRDVFNEYPAIAALGTIGDDAELSLVDFIANSDEPLERRNATYALVLIHRDYPIVVSLLHNASKVLASSASAADRTRATRLALEASDFAHQCSDKKRKECEQALVK